MKCPVCSSEVKELYNLNTETDEFKCGNGDDTITDFNEAEGDKASGNCE